jgi:CubicO group peptidase (beta-lactamase class C family)
MNDTGYYELDRLPKNCAINYIWDEERKEYRTNIYGDVAKGVGDGGVYLTVLDVEKFWDALLGGRLLSAEMTSAMLTRQAGDENSNYGYGIWLTDAGEPFFQGCDSGISFFSGYNSHDQLLMTIISNTGDNVWNLAGNIRGQL